ncbi:MAG: hypothetical protein IJ329_02695 [Clostridia bacterium]|nr:hypothetical protein [Clostridia bacterium]
MEKENENQKEKKQKQRWNSEWERIFAVYEREIKNYSRYRWNAYTTKERLIEKRDALLKIAENLDNVDLIVLYYIYHIDWLGKWKMVELLRKAYQAQCAFQNEFFQTDTYVDIVEIGVKEPVYREKRKKSQKND